MAFLAATARVEAAPDDFKEGAPAWEILASERPRLMERFGGYAPGPSVQSRIHADGTTSLLIFMRGPGAKPVLFRLDKENKILWSDYQPLAKGGFAYEVRLAINGDEGLLVWHDTEPSAVRARAFDSQGKPLWTRDVVDLPWSKEKPEHLTSLNAVSWGKHGWGLAFVTTERAGMQRLDAEGKVRWKQPLVVGENFVYGSISLIQDAPDTIFVLWKGGKDQFNPAVFIAMRVKFDHSRVWPRPIEIGPAPALLLVMPREIELQMTPDGVLAALYRGQASDTGRDLTEYQARIARDGKVEILKP